MYLGHFEDYFGLRFARIQNRCSTDVKWKHKSVAKAVRVEELGRGERNIVGLNIEYAARVIFATVKPIGMRVDRGFGPAGAPRCPEPEGNIILTRGCSLQNRRGVLEKFVPVKITLDPLTTDDYMLAISLAR